MTSPAAMGSIEICCISLNMTDRIRLIGVPMSLVDEIREAIIRGWGQSIQDERPYHGTHEFKLRGNPWYGQGDDAVAARRLVTYILICMARNGWNFVQSADVSKKNQDKDTLFFENANPDPEVQIFSVSFNMGDRIRIIDAPNMMPYLKDAVVLQWGQGKIQNEREYHGSLELKLEGNPWWPNGTEAARSKMLLNQLLANFRAVGFKLYGSIDLSIAQRDVGDLESWFFRKVGPSWQ